ncbi:HD-GYP domain-containing protein [Schinkia azotoformans MEV2011]|uniref:HD-GYP domain-containing protein n=1 Tax=Schinkia azotoformans MEV2011 TaxID=1348973 RepID=A0A072NYS5_SCHAZ|nr:HD domain-containing phosphohydrolase [Schinkia azotoformans]KEF38410.1 HD-GYP domain-containing protein [Schinkia azotoformans MEV2011]MEC1694152.1 HD domain-containing phosphohydrolase [Schinkia azotoformans]MEC1724842.1 HD domain-containing phosphohydrolase [Schinkia azotoformans]MEC1780922.1 HD domain-containing phosphohydrolase [Schinkia azotoformans]MED4330552.1 HD domain-containing phosphohydrolase [Schinkia azotoformans]
MGQTMSISKVKPGMILAEDVMNHNKGILVKKGFKLTDRIIEMLFNKYNVKEVVIKIAHNQAPKNFSKKETNLSSQHYAKNKLAFLDSTDHLEMIKKEIEKMGKLMIETNFVRHSIKVEKIFMKAIQQEQIIELLLKLRVISNNGRENLHRYIKTSLLATATGINLNLDDDNLLLLARASLVYDIGNCIIDQNLLNNNSLLPKNDKKKLEEHVIAGFQILQHKFPKEICLPAYQHHERFDGSGYPNGLENDQLHFFSRIIGIVDVYTALSSNRPHRSAYPTNEVIEFLLGSGDVLFEYKIIVEFLSIINIYVAGSFVLLNNGDIGIVSEINGNPLGKPKVKLLYDKEWRNLNGKEVDLSRNPLYFIKKVID